MFWLSLGLRWCVDFFQALGCRDKARGTSAVVTVVGWCSLKLRSPSYPKLLVMLSYLYLMLSQFYSFLSYIIYTLSYVTLLDSCWSFACYHVTHQPGSYQTSLPSRCTSKTNEDHKNTSRKEVKNSQELSRTVTPSPENRSVVARNSFLHSSGACAEACHVANCCKWVARSSSPGRWLWQGF
jgi:hypothetical protein